MAATGVMDDRKPVSFAQENAEPLAPMYVWDIVVRGTHWIIALSILVQVVAARRGERSEAHDDASAPAAASQSSAPPLAVDPICGMTVAAVPGTPSVIVDGETVYFCCEGCASAFRAQQRDHALAE